MMSVDLSAYSWPGVLEFLYSQYQKLSLKQNLWFLQKKQLGDQIKELQGKVAAAEAINADLRNKNNMLQHCIREMKFKSNAPQKLQGKQAQIPIPQRRVKSNKNQVTKILASLGLSNLFQNINKDLKTKNTNHHLKIQIPLSQGKQQEHSQKPASKYKLLANLQEHQDGVRDVCFLNDKQYLVSVSEDSTMKIWNLEKSRQNIDCISTIKEHSGPIFTAVEGDGYLFTGGMEGIVRCWNFPKKTINSKKCLVSQWTNSDEQKLQPIWQLLYYGQKKMLFSTSSETAIRCFQLEYQENSVSAKYKHSYLFQSKSNEQEDIPTAICIHQNALYAGYVNNNILIQFNLENQKPTNSIDFLADGQISTNKIISNRNIIAGAFEDGIIRIFDHSKLVYNFKAHEQSVMSLAFTNNPHQLFSCGQDGFVKLWDMRKYQEISSFHAHKKKYDESCHCISFGSGNLVASGGVDGVINLYGLES